MLFSSVDSCKAGVSCVFTRNPGSPNQGPVDYLHFQGHVEVLGENVSDEFVDLASFA